VLTNGRLICHLATETVVRSTITQIYEGTNQISVLAVPGRAEVVAVAFSQDSTRERHRKGLLLDELYRQLAPELGKRGARVYDRYT
jgi:hypothetical protein